MTIQLNLSTGKKIELTEAEFQEIKESLKNIKDNVWTINTNPWYPLTTTYYDTSKML